MNYFLSASLNPDFKYGRLEENTEIHVGDESIKSKPTTSKSSSDNILKDLSFTPVMKCTYRIHPLPVSEWSSPFKVYVHRSQLPAVHFENGKTFGLLRKVKQHRENVKSGALFVKKLEGPLEFMVSLFFFFVYIYNIPCIYQSVLYRARC